MRLPFMTLNEECKQVYLQRNLSPFRDYIGQDAAISKLADYVYQAYSDPYHVCRENIMLVGPPSAGKTACAERFGKWLGSAIPKILTDANQVNGGVQVGDRVFRGGADTLIYLMLAGTAQQDEPVPAQMVGALRLYKLLPTVVFIDEIHGLARKTADSLLKATERSDGMLFGKDSVVDCKNVTWIGATTDWGKLPPAFRSRFSAGRIDLLPLTPTQVAQVVQVNMQWDMAVCVEVVKYAGLVPREVLGFARAVQRYAERSSRPPQKCVWEVAQREGIDQFGMRRQRLAILTALQSAPAGLLLRQLAQAIGVQPEELTQEWLPPMLTGGLVEYDTRYYLSDKGRAELVKRGLAA